MSNQAIRSDALSEPSGHFSQAVLVTEPGRLLFVSGMTARGADGAVVGRGDIKQQTHQVCRNLAAALEAAGGSLSDVVRVDVFVRNIEHFSEIHEVRREYFSSPAPASTMLEVSKMVDPEMLIEINAVASLA
jgi:2-iminobutanoate/2-iminopropanoate deaminase